MRHSTRAAHGGWPGRPPLALISCSPRPPMLVSAGAEATQLAAAGGRARPRVAHRSPPVHISRSACLARRGWGETRPRAAHDSQPVMAFSTRVASSAPPANSTPVNKIPDEPLFSQAAQRCCTEIACCKHMFQIFRMFQRYVASVRSGCCKNRSGCCICCNGVHVCCGLLFPMFRTYLVSVFIWILHIFHT
jgi:hypothetical protein